jgi:hypothetical protein
LQRAGQKPGTMTNLIQVPLPGLPFRILVTGWRHWPRAAASVVTSALDAVVEELASDVGKIIVTEGQSPLGGVDDYAWEWAVLHQPRTVPDRHPADWLTLGKAAGPVRNSEMVRMHPDVVLAFPGPGSKGTINCMKLAEAAGLLVRTYDWKDYGLRP